MITNKIDVAGIVLGVLGTIIVGLFIFVVVTLYDDHKKEQLCLNKGGVVLKDRREVHCVKPDFFIPLK